MVTNKVVLNDFDIEVFYLCAIHTSIPSYKTAFLLNKHLGLQLKRAQSDLELGMPKEKETYPKYVFEDEVHYVTYTLVKNKCTVEKINTLSENNGSLFSEHKTSSVIKNLVSEYKNVDYFLKIESDTESFGVKSLVSQVLEIKQIITAYSVDYNRIKKKTNLIFE